MKVKELKFEVHNWVQKIIDFFFIKVCNKMRFNDNSCLDNCPSEDSLLRNPSWTITPRTPPPLPIPQTITSEQLPPAQIPQAIAPHKIPPRTIAPPCFCPLNYCPGKILRWANPSPSPGNSPMKFSEDNCPSKDCS